MIRKQRKGEAWVKPKKKRNVGGEYGGAKFWAEVGGVSCGRTRVRGL